VDGTVGVTAHPQERRRTGAASAGAAAVTELSAIPGVDLGAGAFQDWIPGVDLGAGAFQDLSPTGGVPMTSSSPLAR
jgi:hypothetical protein